ncbi:MAG: oxidoreductase [Variovorax sp.]|nr:MAG: oxidoreductase [Variovorax sp.]
MTTQASQSSGDRLNLLVRQIRFEGIGINSYELVNPTGAELPPFEAGAHIDIHVEQGITRQYSLCNDPAERHRYVIAVLCDETGRGGSKKLHETVHVQDVVPVGVPRSNFHLKPGGKAILLAGGIGVTPLKSMAHQLARAGVDYVLHYCAKDLEHTAFREDLGSRGHDGRHQYHFDNGNPANGLNIAELLHEREEDTHLYYCGPAGFMKACAAAAEHWPSDAVHCEHFKAPGAAANSASGVAPGSFVVKMRSNDESVVVGPDQSIVEALAGVGVAIETSCQSGLCGSCKVRYVSGDVEHNDCILSDEDHEQYMTACVSRARSGSCLVLDV